jgi:hypothetical protein
MGNNYSVIPTGGLDEVSRRYLEHAGDPIPANLAGRWPTMRELRAVMETFDGYEIRYSSSGKDDVDIEVSGPEYAVLWVKPGESEDAPCDFAFHKPDELLALRVLERLARICGPLVLFEASGCTSVLVTGGDDPAEAMQRWKSHYRQLLRP